MGLFLEMVSRGSEVIAEWSGWEGWGLLRSTNKWGGSATEGQVFPRHILLEGKSVFSKSKKTTRHLCDSGSPTQVVTKKQAFNSKLHNSP